MRLPSPSRTTPSRLTSGALIVTLLTTLLLATASLVAPSADAAWWKAVRYHQASTQLCKVKLDKTHFRLKMRLDNRRADHRHLGYLVANQGTTSEKYVLVRRAAGGMSKVKSLRATREDELVVAVADINGQVWGKQVFIREIKRC